MDFIQQIAPIIQKYCLIYGYKFPSAIIAQAICESNWGRSKLAAVYRNYFGMKCGSSWKGKSVNMKTKEEYQPGVLTSISDNFRAYNSIDEGIKGYFEFISKPRYNNLKSATSPEDYVRLLKEDGYATSSSYVSTLTNIINKNNLKIYDNGKVEYKREVDTMVVTDILDLKYGNGADRKKKLEEAGYVYEECQKIVNEVITASDAIKEILKGIDPKFHQVVFNRVKK